MSKKSVFCIAPSRQQADQIVEHLKKAAFSNDDISVLFPDKESVRDFAHEKHTKAAEGATAGVGTGGLIGGALGWIAGMGVLAIPGMGPFIAAGPLLAALSGAALAATVGGIAGGLIGLGIPEFTARRYDGKIKEGDLLLSVHTDTADDIARAKEIFSDGGATDICATGEASLPKPKATPSKKRKSNVERRNRASNLSPKHLHSLRANTALAVKVNRNTQREF
jgi:hypothetical protein